MAGTSGSRRRGRRAAGRRAAGPPQHLTSALRRQQLARRLSGPLAERIEGFLDLYTRLARRRVLERLGMTANITGRLAAWGALAATDEEHEAAGRLLGAAILIDEPEGFAWHALAEGRLEDEVQTAFRRATRSGEEAGIAGPVEAAATPAAALGQDVEGLDVLRRLAPRIRAREATVAEVRDAVQRLLALQWTLVREFQERELEENVEETLDLAAACHLMGVAADGHASTRVSQALDALVGEVTDEATRIRRVGADAERSFAEDEEDDGGGPEGDQIAALPDLDALDSEDEEEIAVVPLLRALDDHLRFIEDPVEGARLVGALAGTLLVGALTGLEALPGHSHLGDRVLAASLVALGTTTGAGRGGLGEPLGEAVLGADNDGEQARDDEMPALTEGALASVEWAAEALSAGLPSPKIAEATSDELFARLDALVEHLSEETAEEGCPIVDSMAQTTAALEALPIGVALARGAPEVQRELAFMLGALDPFGLVEFPELRDQAAGDLRELARRWREGRGPA